MPKQTKRGNKQVRNEVTYLNYNCNSCNKLVHGKYTTCPRCGYFHQDGKARNDWTPTIIKPI